MCPAKPDINIECWFAIARHEKIDKLEKPNGYNSCNAQLCLVAGGVGGGDWVSPHLPPYER